MLLYDSDVSGNCYKVRLLLAQLGLEYERYPMDVVDRSNRKELLGNLNPGLRVPTLVLDDGRALGESGAIMSYLADGTEYAPSEAFDRAKVLQWMFFEQYSHEPFVAVPRFWLTKNIAVDPETLADRQRVGYLAFDAMEAHLAGHEFLAADRYTIADIFNVLNAGTVTRVVETYAATANNTWMTPLALMDARYIRFGMQMSF